MKTLSEGRGRGRGCKSIEELKTKLPKEVIDASELKVQKILESMKKFSEGGE